MMKNLLLTIILTFCTLWGYAQTTYTFTGDGTDSLWENIDNWDIYPGTTISENDIVEIKSGLSIGQNSTIVNKGTLIAKDQSIYMDIIGTLESTGAVILKNVDLIIEGVITLSATNNTLNTSSLEIMGSDSKIINAGKITVGNAVNFYSEDDVEITNYREFTNLSEFTNFAGIFFNDTNGIFNNYGKLNIYSQFNNWGIFKNDEVNSNLQLLSSAEFNNFFAADFQNSNNSILRITDGSVFTTKISLNNNGAILIDEGDLFVENNFTNAGSLTISDNGTLMITNPGTTFTNSKSLTNNGTINSKSPIVNANTGLFVNNGTINKIEPNLEEQDTFGFLNNGNIRGENNTYAYNFSNAGILEPGADESTVGIYTFGADLIQEETATLEMNIESPTSYDKVDVKGNLSLDGKLIVTLENDFVPTMNQDFIIMNGISVSGEFDSIEYPDDEDDNEDNNLQWSVAYNTDNVTISVDTENTLSTNNFENHNKKLNMHPNPVLDILTIAGNFYKSDIVIYDSLGVIVYQSNAIQKKDKINLSQLSTGMYLVQVGSDIKRIFKR